MSAKLLLEKRAMFLQNVAYEILSGKKVRLATVANLVGDPTIFDKDLSSIISVLYSHNNLRSETLNEGEQPIKLLEQIYQDLEVWGFKLPSFKKRYEWIKSTTGGSFQNDQQQFGGGEAKALDKPLRRLHEHFYELRMHDDGHAQDNRGVPVTKNTGAQLTALVEHLTVSIKRLATEGASYTVQDDSTRAGRQRTEFLDARYDEAAALINRSIGTTADGPKITLYHIRSEEGEERWFAVSERDLPELRRALAAARPEWDMTKNSKFEYVSTILRSTDPYQVRLVFPDGTQEALVLAILRTIRSSQGDQFEFDQDGLKVKLTSMRKDLLQKVVALLEKKYKVESGPLRGARSVEQTSEELEVLQQIAQPSQIKGEPIVQLVRLPFTPDQIDDAFPSVEVLEDDYVGRHLSVLTLEVLKRSRFSGFVEFDDKYRMMVLWANAPSDDEKDAEGQSFREHLIQILNDHQKTFADILGQVPSVIKTKTGACYYFPSAASLPRVIKARSSLEKAIDAVNQDIEAMEEHAGIERSFNRTLDDDELPIHLEETA